MGRIGPAGDWWPQAHAGTVPVPTPPRCHGFWGTFDILGNSKPSCGTVALETNQQPCLRFVQQNRTNCLLVGPGNNLFNLLAGQVVCPANNSLDAPGPWDRRGCQDTGGGMVSHRGAVLGPFARTTSGPPPLHPAQLSISRNEHRKFFQRWRPEE